MNLVSFVLVGLCQVMGNEKKNQAPASLLKFKKQFSVASPSPGPPSFEAALEEKFGK